MFERRGFHTYAKKSRRPLRDMWEARAMNIREIARALTRVNKFVEGDCDVRLQVYDTGEWAIRYGSSDFDLDHRGRWGASSVPGNSKRFNSRDTAKDLISQVNEQ
jgi:hypothetical protein